MIFVFGSNLSGVHGAGAARHARLNCGAEMGVGVGRTGESYALPTKGRAEEGLPVLSLTEIADYAAGFLHYAEHNPTETFQLTAVGCGLAGYTPAQIAPLFGDAPDNVLFPPEWREYFSVFPAVKFWSY